jgi:hypothetical protein
MSEAKKRPLPLATKLAGVMPLASVMSKLTGPDTFPPVPLPQVVQLRK